MSDFNRPRTNLNKYLPSVLSTEINKSINENLFNRFLTKDEQVHQVGYIGSPDTASNYKNIVEESIYFQKNQLQPVVSASVGSQNYYLDFQSFLRKLANLGVDISKFSEWGKSEVFNFAPPIDFDKIINYENYYWIPSNSEDLPDYITIKNVLTQAFARSDESKKFIFNNVNKFQVTVKDSFNISLSGNLTQTIPLNSGIILFDGNSYYLNQINNLNFDPLLDKTIITLVEPIDLSILEVVPTDINILKTLSNGFVLSGDYSKIFTPGYIFSTKGSNVDSNVSTLWEVSSSTYDPILNISTILINTSIPSGNVWKIISTLPLLSFYEFNYRSLLNNSTSNPSNSLWTDFNLGKIIWISSYNLLYSKTGLTNFSNSSVFYDNSFNFINLGIKVGNILRILSGPNVGDYTVLNVDNNYIGIDNTNIFSDSNIEYTIIENNTYDSYVSSTQPSSPEIFDLWINPALDTLSQWNGTMWITYVQNISMLTSLANTKYRISQAQNDPWALSNKWVHKNQINSFTTVVRAQLPIIEYDPFIELSDLSMATYAWSYRANSSATYSASTIVPTLLEVKKIINQTNNYIFKIKDQFTIEFDSSIGNIANDLINAGTIVIGNTFYNNGEYSVNTAVYQQTTTTSRYNTILTLKSPLPNVNDLPVTSYLGPKYTSVGDLWLGYDQHWLFDGLDKITSSSNTVNQNPMINELVSKLSTELYDSNLYLYAQDFNFKENVSGPQVYLDSSLQNIALFDNYQEGDIRVYINGIRQYGSFDDLRSQTLYEYFGGIQFNSSIVLTPKDVLRIEIGEYDITDIGRGDVELVSNDNIVDPTLPYKKFNISIFRKIEQTKSEKNTYPYFKVYDINGTPISTASRFFIFQEDVSYPINTFLERRIVNNSATNDYGFTLDMQGPNGELYCYKKIDNSLQTVWKSGNNGESYVPNILSDGNWDIPIQWKYNLEHSLSSTFLLSQLFDHLNSIVGNQNIPGINLSTKYSPYYLSDSNNYGIGGTIKEHNGSLDQLISAILVQNVDPISLIKFAKSAYDNNIKFIQEEFIKSSPILLNNSTINTLAELKSAIAASLINALATNEKMNKWYGDSTSYNAISNTGVMNWIASPALFGLASLYTPFAESDPSYSLYYVKNHLGTYINTFLNNSITSNIFSTLSKNTSLISQLIDSTTNSFPSGNFSTGNILLRKNISDGSVNYYRFSPLNKWELIDINDIFTNVILTIETELYGVAQNIQSKYDFSQLASNIAFNTLQLARFTEFCNNENITTPFKNIYFNETDPFTWNYYYTKVINYPSNNIFYGTKASYQELYKMAYGTPYPHLEPWALQGYTNKPSWWDAQYLNNDPNNNRKWIASMWNNILNGIVPFGMLLPDGITVSSQTNSQVLSYKYVSVNISDVPTSDGYSPDALLPPYWNSKNSNSSNIRSLFDPSDNISIITPNSDFIFGDGNPNEFLWKTSLAYIYDNLIIAFTLDPLNFFSSSFGNDVVNINCLKVDKDSQKMLSHSSVIFHGEFINNTPYLVNGLNQWYVQYNRYFGFDGDASEFYKLWREWTNKLSYLFNSFTVPNSLFIENQFFDITDKDYLIDIMKTEDFQTIEMDTFNIQLLNVPPQYSFNRDYGNGWTFQLNKTNPSKPTLQFYDVQNYPITLSSDMQTFSIYNYELVNAGIVSPQIYVDVDYSNSLSLNYNTLFVQNRNYYATINFGTNAINLVANTSNSSTIQQFINYLNSQISQYGYVELYNGNLRIISYALNISITDSGLFATLYNNFVDISSQQLSSYIFENNFILNGNQTNIFNPTSAFIIKNSSQFDGSYTVKSSTYNPNTDQTTIFINSSNLIITNNIIDGYLYPYNGKQLPETWTTGTEVYLNTSQILPSPFSDQTPYYLILVDATSFKLAKNINDANAGIAITALTNGSGNSYIGSINYTFAPLGGSTVGYKWCRFNIDYRYLNTASFPITISSIQSLNNFIDGYSAYLEENGITISDNSIDSLTGSINSWQLEKEKFISQIYQIRNQNQLSTEQYNIVPDLANNRFLFQNYSNIFTTGTPIIFITLGNGSILPTPLNDPFKANTIYFMIPSNDGKGFQVAISYQDALVGRAITLNDAGSGSFAFEINQNNSYPMYNVNPYKNSVVINTPYGILNSVTQEVNRNVFIPSIYDNLNQKISPHNLIVYRNNESNLITLTEDIIEKNNLATVPTYICGFKLFVTSYQNLILFNNYSVNNDLIFDPFLGISTPRFYVEFDKQTLSNLRPSFGGYILVDNELMQNMESYVESLRHMYGTYNVLEINPMVNETRKSLGYDGPKTYMSGIDLNDKTQFIFWRGMIKNKGTNLAFDAFTNQPLYSSSDIDEWWAYKISEFGDAKAKNYPEMRLYKSDASTREARFEFSNPQEAPLGYSFTPIYLTDMTRWYNQPEVVNDMAPDSTFYFNADIINIKYQSEFDIKFLQEYGIYIIALQNPCDDVIVTVFDKTTNKQVSLINSTDYIMLNSKLLQLLPTKDINSYINLTIYSVVYNFDAHSPAQLVDKKNKKLVSNIPIFNPLYNQYEPNSYSIVDYHQATDPANYSYYPDNSSTNNTLWDAQQKDTVWFDSNLEIYYPYNDKHIFPNLNDRIRLWANLIDIGEISLYQWTESKYDPLTYDSMAENGISKKSVYKNTGSVNNPIWVEQTPTVLQFFAYELLGYNNPVSGIVNIYRNGEFDLSLDLSMYSLSDYVDLTVQLPNQDSKPNPQDYIVIYQPVYVPSLTDLKNNLYKIDAKYTTRLMVNPADGSTYNLYYFWASNKTSATNKVTNYSASLLTSQNNILSQNRPYMILDGMRSSDSGYGILYGTTFDPMYYQLPIRYTQLIIRGLSGLVTADNQFALRLTNDLTLRDKIPVRQLDYNYGVNGDKTPLSLKNVHTEWKMIREKQPNKIDIYLWEKLISALIGFNYSAGVVDFTTPIPSLTRTLYDNLYNSGTRYGLGNDQIFTDAKTAINTIQNLLTDTSIIYPNIDINEFNQKNNFDNINNIISTMENIYNTFSVSNINKIFFECLYDSMSFNNKNEYFIKTSWVSIDTASVVSTNLHSSNISSNNSIVNGTGCVSLLDILPTPSLPIPLPSATPTITPTVSLTPSITISPSSLLVSTPTPSISPSITITPSVTPTILTTASPTPTPTLTISLTPSISVTPSLTGTPQASVTPTPSISNTPSLSLTPSVTPTITLTPSITPTLGISQSSTPSPSLSPTPSHTPTPTPTPSLSGASKLSASVSPTAAGYDLSATGTQTTNSVTVTASGGSGTGYTYSWSIINNYTISGSGTPNIVANSPLSSTTTFSGEYNSINQGQTATGVCTVTDSLNNTTSVSVSISIT